MIDTSGLSPILAITLINRERDTFEKSVESEPMSKREIADFRERIGSITSVDELTEDFEVFSFVMKAYGFEDLVYGKAMMRRVLSSDPTDKASLASRMNSGGFKAMTTDLGFSVDGKAPAKFKDKAWVDKMVTTYVDRRLVDTQAEINRSVGDALHFQDKAAGYKSWFDVLGDTRAARVLRVAMGVPESLAAADLDSQKRFFEKKMDIADLQDPAKLDKFIKRYAAIQGALEDNSSGNGSLVLSLFSSSTGAGSWNAVTLDMDAIGSFKASSVR